MSASERKTAPERNDAAPAVATHPPTATTSVPSGSPPIASPASPAVSGGRFRRFRTRKWLVIAGLAAAVVVVGPVFGIPWVYRILNTVSTDDAYVNGHV